ncbi:nucleolar protein nop52 family [Grosmannia clavigera kw1407]|uniref:Nucleolar protein nop52 family n=1 Tax=Grosmannia clavigera (strain kw1407 / UAMH 11150) TaxID=655863 RepID=F0XJE6_GROCL|nr:nucleolar protein nop52 family [Grosmannia clavigera kw1407]EFX02377.1 nucleolar protein nop52 family [Grosmannia clavigera kw1407]
MASSAASMPFIKNLASSDRRTRTQSLDTLKAFLSTKYAGPSTSVPLSFLDAHKLWTGLFYALWMADRAPVQQRLCDELAGLPAAVGLADASTVAWLRGFWAIMAQRWTTGIDVLRMDKFLLLVRRVLAAQLAWMAGSVGGEKKKQKKTQAKAAAVQSLAAETAGLSVLQDWPLNPEAETPVDDGQDEDQLEDGGEKRWTRKRVQATVRIPVGLAMHVLDIWVDEAEKLGLLAEAEATEATEASDAAGRPSLVRNVNALVETLAAQTRSPAVRKHAREALTDERLPWNEKAEESADEANSDEDEDMADNGSWDGFE